MFFFSYVDSRPKKKNDKKCKTGIVCGWKPVGVGRVNGEGKGG
jgi:hypothetical protein